MFHPRISAELARQRQAQFLEESRRDALARLARTQRAPLGASAARLVRVRRIAGALAAIATIILAIRLPDHIA